MKSSAMLAIAVSSWLVVALVFALEEADKPETYGSLDCSLITTSLSVGHSRTLGKANRQINRKTQSAFLISSAAQWLRMVESVGKFWHGSIGQREREREKET